MNLTTLFTLQIDTKKSVPQESKPKARKIFVGGLAPETTEGRCCFVAFEGKKQKTLDSCLLGSIL